jgi:hypothetical protein
MVTVEIAFGGLAVAAAMVLLAWVLTVVMLMSRCQDLAMTVARQQARADSAAVAKLMAERPEGAKVDIEQGPSVIKVTVTLDARPWAPWLPGVPVNVSATAIREPL